MCPQYSQYFPIHPNIPPQAAGQNGPVLSPNQRRAASVRGAREDQQFRFPFSDFFFFPNFCRCKLNFFFPDVDSKRVDELVKKIRFNNNEPTETDQAILLQKTSSAGLRGVLCQNVPSEEDVTSKAAAGKFQQENSNNWKNSIIL